MERITWGYFIKTPKTTAFINLDNMLENANVIRKWMLIIVKIWEKQKCQKQIMTVGEEWGEEKLVYSSQAHRKTQVPIVVSTAWSIQNGHLKDN